MRILLVHNTYQQPGGEDVVFSQEQEILVRAGHQVLTYCRSNWEIAGYSALKRLTLVGRMTWARDTRREIASLLHRHKPDVAHFHNTFPLISPAAYYACREAGVPVVQSLHNPRFFCPAATCYRNSRVCEQCLGKTFPWPSVVHGCYRGSRLQTAAVAAMIAFHKMLKSWARMVGRYIVFTDFYRQKFVEAGLPADKIVVKPHFVEDPGVRQRPGGYALFIGRLVPEKGLHSLIDAWIRLKGRIPLVIVGDGPLRPSLEMKVMALGLSHISLAGHLSPEQVSTMLGGARFLVFPSEWYETFGLVVAEAFACGAPVLASRLGAMEELVADGQTGLLFRPNDPDDLAAKVDWAWAHEAEMEIMGHNARKEYEAKYTPDQNYRMLMEIYRQAVRNCEAARIVPAFASLT